MSNHSEYKTLVGQTSESHSNNKTSHQLSFKHHTARVWTCSSTSHVRQKVHRVRERVLPRSIVPAVGLEDRFVPSGFSFVAKHCLLKALVAVPQVAPLRATQRTEPARPQHRGARPQQERVSCVAVLRYHCERGAKAGARLDAMHARHVPTAACYVLCFGRWGGPPPPTRQHAQAGPGVVFAESSRAVRTPSDGSAV